MSQLPLTALKFLLKVLLSTIWATYTSFEKSATLIFRLAFSQYNFVFSRFRYDLSEEHYLQAHGVRSRVLPGDGSHPDQIVTLHNLVSLYAEAGNKEKEERMSALLLKMLQKVEGKEGSSKEQGSNRTC